MTVDVHGHLSPPESIRRYPMPPSLGDAEAMIEAKLAAGVELTIIGSPVGAGAMVPLPGVDNYGQSEDELARFHDWMSETIRRWPRHLRGYVYDNPFGGSRHLTNVAERLRQPEFVGMIANTSVAGRHLNDPDTADFFALAAEADVPVLLHAPAAPAAGTGLEDLMLLEQLGRFNDVTTGVACVVLGGWFDRHPHLRLLAQGAGGAVGLLAEKLDRAFAPEHWAGGGSDGARGSTRPGPPRTRAVTLAHRPSWYLRRFWVDTATPSRAALRLAVDTVGTDHVVFGTDSPPLPLASVAAGLRLVQETVGPAADQVRESNAYELFAGALPVPTAGGTTPADLPHPASSHPPHRLEEFT